MKTLSKGYEDIEVIKAKVDDIDTAMLYGGVYTKAEIKKGFADLNQSELKDYFKSFYWTLSNYLTAYRSLSTGKTAGYYDGEVTTTEKYTEKGLDKVAGFVGEVVKNSVPLIGPTLVSIMDTWMAYSSSQKKTKKLTDKVNAINLSLIHI